MGTIGKFVLAVIVSAIAWVLFSVIVHIFPSTQHLFENYFIAAGMLYISIGMGLSIPIGIVVTIVLGIILSDIWYAPVIQYIILELFIKLALAISVFAGAGIVMNKLAKKSPETAPDSAEMEDNHKYYHTKKSSKTSDGFQEEPFEITHTLRDKIKADIDTIDTSDPAARLDSADIFLMLPIVSFSYLAESMGDIIRNNEYRNDRERRGATKLKPAVDKAFPVIASDRALLYVAMVYYLHLYRYIEDNGYDKLVKDIVELSEIEFYKRYADVFPDYKEDVLQIKNNIHQSLLYKDLGYKRIGLDLTMVLTKYVLIALNPNMEHDNDNDKVIMGLDIYANRWAASFMPSAYDTIQKLEKDNNNLFHHDEEDKDIVPTGSNVSKDKGNKKDIPAGNGMIISNRFFTITFLDTIGLKDWLETRGSIQLMLAIVEEFGKVIPGYSGEFHCGYLEYVKLVFHVEPDGKTVVGFSIHFPCRDIWNLMVTDGKVIADERVDRFSKCLHFNKMDAKDKVIPIRIVCADVLPCYSAGEEISMAVAAFPTEIHYYPSEEAWAHRLNKRLMNKVVDFTDNIHGWFGDLTVIKGKVKKIAECSSRNTRKEQKFFYCVTVETDFGDIGIYHAIDAVREAEREFIREGAYVFTSCVIQGDVAIGKYENGAIYDEEHCLKLLKDCFESSDFSRVKKALAEKVKYSSENFRSASIDNKDNIIRHLQDLNNGIKNSGKVTCAYLAKVNAYHGNETNSNIPAGKHILALAYGAIRIFGHIMAIEINEENKIGKINVEYITHYSVSIREDRHYEPDECAYLKLIKDALDSGDSSRLINYLDYNAIYKDSDGEHYDGWYAVLGALGGIIQLQNTQHVKVNKFLVKVAKGADSGKVGIGISFQGVEECKFVIFIDVVGDKIRALQFIPNEYVLEELKYKDGGLMRHIARTAVQWLGVIKNWIEGEAINKTEFYSAIDADCALTEDDGKMIKMTKGQKNVFTKLVESINSVHDKYCRIEKELLISNFFTLSLTVGNNGEIKLFRLKLLSRETVATPVNKVQDALYADDAKNTITTNTSTVSVTSHSQQLAITLDDLPKLKKMLDDGVITQEEFDAAKKKVLGDMETP